MKQKKSILTMIIFFFLCSTITAFSDGYANKRALQNISTVKTYFDVNMGIAKKLVTRLKLIDTTYEQLTAAGVRPEFVVGFRGKASRFVTNGNEYIPEENVEPAPKTHKNNEDSYIQGMGKINTDVKILLDVHKLLFSGEMQELAATLEEQ